MLCRFHEMLLLSRATRPFLVCPCRERGLHRESTDVLPHTRKLLSGIGQEDRACLAEAITLVESSHPLKRHQANWLLTKLLSQKQKERQLGSHRETFRIGLSGPPGAGKSTLIERFGRNLTAGGHKVAVLGLKKGVVEMADLVIVNKADGDLLPAANRMRSEYTSALKLIRKKSKLWLPKVIGASALSNEGLDEMWGLMEEFWRTMEENGEIQRVRREQSKKWLWSHINWELIRRFRTHSSVSGEVCEVEECVMAGGVPPGVAAETLLDKFFASSTHSI